MAFPSSSVSLAETLLTARNHVAQVRSSAQSALTTLGAGSVDTNYVVRLMSEFRTLIAAIAQWKLVAGIDAAATAQWPNYAGNFTTDVTAVSNAAQGCIDWIVTNFPKDGSNYMLGFQLAADGSLTPRSFTSGQTAGLRTAITSFLATIT